MNTEEWAYGIILRAQDFTDEQVPESYEIFWPDKPNEEDDAETKRE